MRIVYTVLVSLTVLLLVMTLRNVNSNKDLIRYTGRWKGGFTVESVTNGTDTADSRHAHRLEGFLQVYLTNHKYKLHLEGQQEGIDVDGTWTANGDRLTLNPKAVAIDDQGGEEKRDPNKPYIPNEDVLATYNKPIVLVQSADKKGFQGLKVTLGNLLGSHAFVKDGA